VSVHSLLGASGAHRWLHCPGSFALTKKLPAQPSSIYAVTGTIAHQYIENAVDQWDHGLPLKIDQAELGRAWLREGHHVTVDQDFIDGVNVMLDYVDTASVGADYLRCEFRVSLDGYGLGAPVPMFGWVDIATVNHSLVEIVDFKNGAGVVVPPKDNPQLLYYAAGVLSELRNAKPFPPRVRLTIVQPHAPGVEPIRSWDTTAVDVLMWVDDVLGPAVRACAEPNAPLVPGPWCRFCPAVRHCPRLIKDAVEMAKREFDDVAIPTEPAELADALDIADRAILWAEKTREYAVNQLQRQVRIPGWELVPTRPTRQWIKDDKSMADLLRVWRITPDMLYEISLRSPAQIQKLLGKSKDARELWSVIETKLVQAKSSGLKLARARDTNASEDFSDGE
jgi:Protein of unknown function (DUF2800)